MADFLKKYGIIVVLLVNILLYYPSINSGFLLDDKLLIKDDFRITNVVHLPKFFPLERPVREFTLMIDYYLHQYDTRWYHFTNIVMHLLVILFLFRLFTVLGFNPIVSFFTILLFSVHPFSMDAVYVITHRKEILALLFGIFAILSYKEDYKWITVFGVVYTLFLFVISKRWDALVYLGILLLIFYMKRFRKYLYYIISYMLSILSKESGIFFPFSIYGLKKEKGYKFFISFPLIIIGLSLFFIKRLEFVNYSLSYPFIKVPYYLFLYIKMFLFPFSLFSMMPYAKPQIWEIVLGYLFIVGIGYLILINWKRYKFFIIWALSFYLPVSGILPVKVAFGIRYFYAILPFLMFIITDTLYRKKDRIIYIFVLYIFTASIFNISHYKNSEMFWKWEIKHNPNPTACNNLGILMEEKGNESEAKEYYSRAIEISDGTYFKSVNNLASLYYKEKKYKEAIRLFRRATEISSTPQVYFNTGLVYYKISRYDSAEYFYRKALELEPRYDAALRNLILVEMRLNKTDTIFYLLKDLIKIDPRYTWAYDMIKPFFERMGDTAAIEECDRMKNYYKNWKSGDKIIVPNFVK